MAQEDAIAGGLREQTVRSAGVERVVAEDESRARSAPHGVRSSRAISLGSSPVTG
jgi:hypothetical protein